MNFSSFLRCLGTRAQPVPVRAVRAPAADVAEPDRPLGCGWFDSSHELNSGLVIQEYATTAMLGTEPQLAW